jgi:hypothetical protein
MSRFTLSAERINPTDDTSYLVGKESNNSVAVVTRDHDGLHCMRCSGKRASEGVGQCAHILAVQELEKPKAATYQQHTHALTELIEQAAREDDGNFFSGAEVGEFVTAVRVTMPNGQVVKLTIEIIAEGK